MAEGKNLVGVDIGASSIKVVQLKEARKKLQVVAVGLRRASAADDHRRPRHERRRRHRGPRSSIFHGQEDPAAGRRHRRLRPVRHRPQDHRPDDDRRRSSTSRSTGRPSSTSPSTSSSCRSTTRSSGGGPRPGRWISCSSPRRRTRSTTTPRSSARRSSSRLVVDINAFTIQNIFEHQYGLPRGRHHRAAQRRRRGLVAQHRLQGRQRLHARDHERRQRHHRGDPEGAAVLVRAGRGLQDAAAARRRSSRRKSPDHQPGVPGARRRDPALARLLPRDERRAGDQPHLRLRAAARTSRRSRRPSRSARACPCRSSTRW